MTGKKTWCVYDGDTYLGTFDEFGRGGGAAIVVRYGSREMTASVDPSMTAQAAARSVLVELVRTAPSATRT